MSTSAPSWVTPGAEVVVWCYQTGGGRRLIAHTTLDRVATRSFTVKNLTQRFRIDTQECHVGGSWGDTWRVVPASSDEGRAVLAEDRQRKLVTAAWNACEDWIRDRTREHRLAAIAALQAIDDD